MSYGNGKEQNSTQLCCPLGVIVDQCDQYVADCNNHRKMRRTEGENEGSIIAGRN